MPPTCLTPAITSRFDPPLASDPCHRSQYASITTFLEVTVSSTRLLIICGKLLKGDSCSAFWATPSYIAALIDPPRLSITHQFSSDHGA